MVTFVMPSARVQTGTSAITKVSNSSDDVGQGLIKLKDTTPQIGKSPGFLVQEGKIILSGRAISHGKYDFVILKNGEFNLGAGHSYLSRGAQEVLAIGL